MKHAMIVAAAAALLTLTACSGDKGPTKEDGVKVVEGFFTEQGRQATLQRSWRMEVTDAGGSDLDCEKKPNGDQECLISGSVRPWVISAASPPRMSRAPSSRSCGPCSAQMARVGRLWK